MADTARQAPNPAPTKKLYRKPQLQIYGDIHALTQNAGKVGAMDNFKGFKTR